MPIVHASAVAVSSRAALIIGASGTGKSSLALQLIALGAGLICDDRVDLTLQNGALIAGPAPNLTGKIEARGLGILLAPTHSPCTVATVIDLDQTEDERLPQRRITLHGVDLPLLHYSKNPAWPAALWLYLSRGPAQT